MDVNIYLSFDGRCAEAFESTPGCSAARSKRSTPRRDADGRARCRPSSTDKVMHAQLRVGDRVIMGADAPPEWFRSREASRSS